MENLSYEELILLDNLIYLRWDAKENDTIKEIVDNILSIKNFNKLMDDIGNCVIKMPQAQWVRILNQIRKDNNLSNLRISEVDDYKRGMKFACLVQENNTAIVVFRGTSTISEWEDNGEGAYKNATDDQLEALSFVNKLNYKRIIVTGHSKGGNKAQFVTILSAKVNQCISIDGQGFSDEFIEKYKEEILENKYKIISINAQFDYVSCLFNIISDKTHYIKTGFQINPFDYHKAIILLNEEGILRDETSESILSSIINGFSISVLSNLPKDMQKIIIDRVIDVIELFLCKEGNDYNIFKIAGEFLIMYFYENYFEYDEIFHFNYGIVEILILPLIFWNDFIYIEETKSKERLNEIILKIGSLSEEILNRLKLVDNTQKDIINNLSKEVSYLTDRLQNLIL